MPPLAWTLTIFGRTHCALLPLVPFRRLDPPLYLRPPLRIVDAGLIPQLCGRRPREGCVIQEDRARAVRDERPTTELVLTLTKQSRAFSRAECLIGCCQGVVRREHSI